MPPKYYTLCSSLTSLLTSPNTFASNSLVMTSFLWSLGDVGQEGLTCCAELCHPLHSVVPVQSLDERGAKAFLRQSKGMHSFCDRLVQWRRALLLIFFTMLLNRKSWSARLGQRYYWHGVVKQKLQGSWAAFSVAGLKFCKLLPCSGRSSRRYFCVIEA